MKRSSLQRYVLLLLAIILTVVILHYGQALLLLIIFPTIFSFLLLPFTQRMERWGLPRWLSAVLSTMLLVMFLGGIMTYMGSRFVSFKDGIPMLQERLDLKLETLQGFVSEHLNVTAAEQIRWLEQQVRNLSTAGGKLAMDLFSWTGGFLSNVVLIIIILLLILMYRDRFRKFFQQLSEERNVPALSIVQKISALTRQYLKGVGLVVLILAVLNSAGFLIIGLNHAILLGVASAMLTIIPYVGTLIGGLLPLAVAFLTKDSMYYPVAVMGVVGLSQFLEGNFITPKVVGSSVSLNPLASILALVAGGMLWGIAGMILAIPLVGMFKVVCDSVPALQPYGFLLGEETDRKWRRMRRKVKKRVGDQPNFSKVS